MARLEHIKMQTGGADVRVLEGAGDTPDDGDISASGPSASGPPGGPTGAAPVPGAGTGAAPVSALVPAPVSALVSAPVSAPVPVAGTGAAPGAAPVTVAGGVPVGVEGVEGVTGAAPVTVAGTGAGAGAAPVPGAGAGAAPEGADNDQCIKKHQDELQSLLAQCQLYDKAISYANYGITDIDSWLGDLQYIKNDTESGGKSIFIDPVLHKYLQVVEETSKDFDDGEVSIFAKTLASMIIEITKNEQSEPFDTNTLDILITMLNATLKDNIAFKNFTLGGGKGGGKGGGGGISFIPISMFPYKQIAELKTGIDDMSLTGDTIESMIDNCKLIMKTLHATVTKKCGVIHNKIKNNSYQYFFLLKKIKEEGGKCDLLKKKFNGANPECLAKHYPSCLMILKPMA
jgi:hypothetical protein